MHNRRYLDSHLQTLFERAMTRRRPLSMMIADLDHFKRVNDSYGHEVGDLVLREAARRLRQNVRGIDLACRYGGEEFVIVMPETTGEIAEKVAERIRVQIEGVLFEADGRSLPMTASFGISTLAWGNDTLGAMMKRADEALYRAKNAGRNQVAGSAYPTNAISATRLPV